MKRALIIAAAYALVALASGCAEDDGGDGVELCAGRPCPSACEKLAGPPCDVLDPGCQKRVLRAVVCARDTPGRLPEVRVLTQDALEEEERAHDDAGSGQAQAGSAATDPVNADAGAPGASDGGTPATSDDGSPWLRAYVLLGLYPEGAEAQERAREDQDDALAGIYVARERRVTLIDRGTPQNDWSAIAVFAHELVHALQDQSLGLAELWDGAGATTDGRFSLGCLVEGEAELSSELALALLRGAPFDEAYFAANLDRQLKYARRAVASAGAPGAAVWQLRYPVGARYLFDAYRQDGPWAVQGLFEATPTAGVHWMVGHEHNTTRTEHLLLPLACELAQPPAGYELYGETRHGAAMLFAFLVHALPEPNGVFASEEHWRNAQRWRNDDLSVFTNEAGQVAVSYRVRFADDAQAKALARALAANERVPLVVRRHGAELELLAAEDSALLAPDALSWETSPDACPLPE